MSDRKMIGLPADVYERFVEYGEEGDTDLVIVRRILDTLSETEELRGRISDLVSSNEHLLKVNTEIRETLEEERQRHQAKFDDQVYEIGQLQARITTLENAAGTAIVPAGGQVTLDSFGSLGMKDIADEIHDGCAGDESCIGTVAKLQQIRIEAMSKHLDRDHDAEQKRLDRELKEDLAGKERGEKVKDREFREKLTTQEQQNKVELQLLKKGIIKKSVLDDAAFVNIASVPKRPNKEIENRKRQAQAEVEDEETYDYDPEETTDDHID